MLENYVGISHHLKGLEITYQYICLSSQSDNIESVKKRKEIYGKIENIFFRRRVWISVGSSHIFLKALKLPINPYFCRPNRIILSRLKKGKKNIEKSKIFFYGAEPGYLSEVVTFS